MNSATMRRFADGVWEDANGAADIESFRRSLVDRIGNVIGLDMAVIAPAGPLGDDDERGTVAVGFDPKLFAHYLRNRHRYYPSMRPLLDAVRVHGVVFGLEVFGVGFRRLEVFREVMVPAGVKSQLNAMLAFRGHATGALNLQRHEGSSSFRRGNLEQLRALVPMAGMADAAVVARCASCAQDGLSVVALSPREREVASLIQAGLQNKEIAAALGTSVDTVRKQTIRIYEKLGVTGRVNLVVRFGARFGRPRAGA